MSQLLALYNSAGAEQFTAAVCQFAPYFNTIAPSFTELRAGRAEATVPFRREITNHLGTVHAIALCNAAELVAGTMTDASIPAGHRWIPKGMTVQYLKKAVGTQRGVATPTTPIVSAAAGYDLPVNVDVFDPAGERVFNAVITMWLSPKK